MPYSNAQMRLCTRIRPDTTWSTGIGDEEESRIRQAGVSSAVQKYITVYLGEFDDSNDERRIRSEAFFEKLVLFAVLLVLLPFPITSYAASGADAWKSQKVRVGWYNSDHFQEGEADNAQKRGYSYEYLQDISNYTGWEYEYVNGSWSELYQALIDGKNDVLGGLSYTEDRAELIAGYTEVFKRADQAMYEDKKAFYEKHGDRQRRE